MPSLLPSTIETPDLIRLNEVFRSERTKATTERVLKYLGRVFDTASNRPEAERDHPFLIVEEFDLFMPTERAWLDELALCEAILHHADGRMTDLAIKDVLDRFIESHVYVYERGTRRPKVGDWSRWAECELVHLYSPTNQNIAITCNPVQAMIAIELIPDEGLRVLRLG